MCVCIYTMYICKTFMYGMYVCMCFSIPGLFLSDIAQIREGLSVCSSSSAGRVGQVDPPLCVSIVGSERTIDFEMLPYIIDTTTEKKVCMYVCYCSYV